MLSSKRDVAPDLDRPESDMTGQIFMGLRTADGYTIILNLISFFHFSVLYILPAVYHKNHKE